MDILLSSNDTYPADQFTDQQFKGGEQLFAWTGNRYIKIKK